jgi:hypothetical protein
MTVALLHASFEGGGGAGDLKEARKPEPLRSRNTRIWFFNRVLIDAL